MPEWSEVKISSDFINEMTKGKNFTAFYNVGVGNEAIKDTYTDFMVHSDSNGKELLLYLDDMPIYIFMGMSGNWKYVPTDSWSNNKYTRMRLDDETGNSLLLHGGFLGPKYSINKPFTGVKRGPDPVKQFENFKTNIINNLSKKDFDKPIYEALLNQKYFNGIGNYLRSTILYYLDINPFVNARKVITDTPKILDLCKDIPLKAYELNGGQLKDWKNPFDSDSTKFNEWVFYKKGLSIKDSYNRTFWYNEKWKQ